MAIGGFGRGLLLLLLANFETLAAPAAGVSKHTRPHRNPPWLLIATPRLQTMLVRPAKCSGEGTMEDCGVGGGSRTELRSSSPLPKPPTEQGRAGPYSTKAGRPEALPPNPYDLWTFPQALPGDLQKAWRTESVRWEEHA